MKYKKIIDVLESNDNNSRKANYLFESLLKDGQKKIFQEIPFDIEEAVSASEIKEKTGIATKNISAQIKQLSVNFPIGVIECENGYKKYYKKE